MKKIIVNREACIGCGACVAIDPEHFDFNDEGLSHAVSSENLESENLINAISSCPTSAISIKEESDDKKNAEGCSCCNCETIENSEEE